MTTILQGIGWVLLKVYEFFESAHIPAAYALALVVFTIVIKILIFPLSYKGKKSMMRMNALQSKMKQLEVQYGKDREKYQQKVQELYAKEKVNPMGGCLWSLLPLPILMGLYSIIRKPMVYMMGISNEAVQTAIKAVTASGVTFTGNDVYQEIQLAGKLNDPGIMQTVADAIPEYADKLQHINFNMFGIDLGATPKLTFWTNFDELGVWSSVGLFLIPLAVTALNFWYTKYSQKTNSALTAAREEAEPKKKKKNSDKPEPKSQAERSSQMMMWMMPLMYLWFGYSMPAGMCVYMAVNAVVTVGQDAICVKMLRKSFVEMMEQQRIKDEQEKAELAAHKAEIAARRAAQEAANKANKGKKGKKKAPKKAPANTNGRIGIRTYALGRDYDPDRYGGVTAYRDPQDIIDENAVEEAYQSKRRRKAAAVEKAIHEAEEEGNIEALEALEAEAAALEEAEEAAGELAAEGAELPAAEEGDASEQPSEEA